MLRNVATLVVCSSTLRREGLVRILSAARFRHVEAVAQLDEVVHSEDDQDRSKLLLISLDGEPETIVQQIAEHKQRSPKGVVICLSDWFDLQVMLQIFRAGAIAFLTQFASCEAFIKSIELALLGEVVLPPELLRTLLDSEGQAPPGTLKPRLQAAVPKVGNLSDREAKILQYVVEGDPNKMIARRLGIAESTVKVHVKSILRKLNLQNRTQAAIWANSGGMSPARLRGSAGAGLGPSQSIAINTLSPDSELVLNGHPKTRLGEAAVGVGSVGSLV